MNSHVENGFIVFIIVLVLGSATLSVIHDKDSKKEWNQQFKDRSCSIEYRVGHGRYSACEYQVWKCPNATNEYLVR